MKPSGVGGMAVMEGVMMKNKDEYAVAVRKPNHEIIVEKSKHKDFTERVKLFKLPIFRGMLAFVDSMVIGLKVLNISASFFEEEEEQTKKDKKKRKSKVNQNTEDDDFIIEELSVTDSLTNQSENEASNIKDEKKEDKDTLLMVAAVVMSIGLSVGLFMVLPVLLTSLTSSFITSRFGISLLEGIVRLIIFIGYILLVSQMKEIKRVFMYHGAEHKTINCLENGFELTVENVKWQSKQHKRCGTSFMLLVMLISLVFFIFLPTGNLGWRIVSRIVLVPVIAGVSYEFIRLAGKSDHIVVRIISQPGLWMQGLTTKEPDDDMIEVAIASVDAVFDWRAFLADTKESDYKKATTKEKKETHNKTAAVKEKIETHNETAATKEKKETHKESSATKEKKETHKESAAANEKKETHKESTVTNEMKETRRETAASKEKKETMEEKPVVNHKEMLKQKTDDVKFRKETVTGTPPVYDDEDDEILKALDKYLDFGSKKEN